MINNNNNYHYNVGQNLKNISRQFEKLKNTLLGDIKYKISNYEYYNFIREDEDSHILFRTYLGHGAKITKKNLLGELTNNSPLLNNSICDIKLNIGTMWINSDTKLYGVHLYINEIIIN